MNKAILSTVILPSGGSLSLMDYIASTSPVAWWKINDGSGASLFDDAIGTADATVTGATFAAGVGIGGGNTWRFDGVNDVGNFAAGALTALNSVFSGQTGTIVLFARSFAVTNAVYQVLIQIGANASNRVYIGRTDTSTTVYAGRIGAGNTKQVAATFPGTFTNWNMYALSWSRTTNELKFFTSNGSAVVQLGTTQTLTTDYTGTLASANTALCAEAGTPVYPFNGWANHFILYNSVKDLTFLNDLAVRAGII